MADYWGATLLGSKIFQPTPGVPVTPHTLRIFQVNLLYQNPQPSIITPVSLLEKALPRAKELCINRFQGAGQVDFTNSYMAVEMRHTVQEVMPGQPVMEAYIFQHLVSAVNGIRWDGNASTAPGNRSPVYEKWADIVERSRRAHAGSDSYDDARFRLSDYIMVTIDFWDFVTTPYPDEDEQDFVWGGDYNDYKKKMYHARDLDAFYHMTDAVMEVPHTEERFCFPMAFMKCQLRILYSQRAQRISETKAASRKEAFEDNGSTDWMDADDLFEPYKCPRLNIASLGERDFYSRSDGGSIVLFNPYKAKELSHEDGFVQHYRTVTDDYKHDWLLAAQDIHQQVELGLMREVNPNNQNEVCQAYSEFFKVHIHLYSLWGTGNRFLTVVDPDSISYQRHVHILVADAHCAPITNIRNFMQRVSGSGRMSFHNFCDICTYTTCSSVNEAKMKKHITECQASNTNCTNKHILEFQKDSCSTVHKRVLFTNVKKELCLGCNAKAKKSCHNESHEIETSWVSACTICKEEVVPSTEGLHLCYVSAPKIKDKLDDDKIWVYDIEAQQNPIGDVVSGNRETPLNILKHECILVCMQQVYTGRRIKYANLEDFCIDLETNPLFDEAVILAHNGGGYDHQYVLQYCERKVITHNLVPHASSAHKFLSLEMVPVGREPRRLLDFMAFVMGSLKQIGKDFGLSFSKGDFPHNFSRYHNLQYKGKIPPLRSPEDYYGYERKRCREDQLELEVWHATEVLLRCSCEVSEVVMQDGVEMCGICNKPAYWDFQVELEKYCWIDVEILAQVVKLYREDALQDAAPEDSSFNWNYKGVDPFTMLTQSQVGINTFLIGLETPVAIASTQYSLRAGYNIKSNAWLREKSEREGLDIIYKGVALKEWYCKRTDSFYAGYCVERKTIYHFLDCEYESCPMCFERGMNHRRGLHSDEVARQRDEELTILRRMYNVEELWEHDFDNMAPNADGRVMNDRQFFYGGRTEVFKAYAKSDAVNHLKYMDVCSLYPFVCATKSLPIGFPSILYGNKIDPARGHFQHPNRYWGFMYCRVIPNRQDILGLLPNRSESGRLQFTVEEQWGCWHTEELYLAQEVGYVIAEIIQVYHWDADGRSDTFVRGYISYWLRQKQEAEGWKKCGGTSEDPTVEEKTQLIERLYAKNGYIGKMRMDKVRKSPVKRLIAKLKLNSWWGKWVQTKIDEAKVVINGYQQYLAFRNTAGVDMTKVRFRHIQMNQFEITYKKIIGYEMLNNKYNIFIGASVTAHARCVLHRRMLLVGPDRMVYCDTDSIVAEEPVGEPSVIGGGLGDWVDEHPNEEIACIYCFAPKSYNLEMENGENELKTKGISLTMQNREKVTKEIMGEMLESEFFVNGTQSEPLLLDNMNITTNSRYRQLPYATLLTLYNKKVMRPVLTKRKMIRYFGDVSNRRLKLNEDFKSIRLVPLGYCRDEAHEKELSAQMYDVERWHMQSV